MIMDCIGYPATNQLAVVQCGLIILGAIVLTAAIVYTLADIYRHRWMR